MMDQPTPTRSEPAVNPYAPPEAPITPGTADIPDNAEAVRHELLKHETSIRGIGSLYILGGILAVIGVLGAVTMALASPSQASGMMIGLAILYAVFGWINFYLGRGLRRLDARVRLAMTILAVIGLIGIPIGTLISGYILYLLHSEKGKRVMTPEYQAIVAQTPHIKYHTPLWLIILALLIVASIVALIVMTMLGS